LLGGDEHLPGDAVRVVGGAFAFDDVLVVYESGAVVLGGELGGRAVFGGRLGFSVGLDGVGLGGGGRGGLWSLRLGCVGLGRRLSRGLRWFWARSGSGLDRGIGADEPCCGDGEGEADQDGEEGSHSAGLW